MLKIIKSIFIIFTLSLCLINCYEGPYTIFENIVNDDPVNDNELDNKLDVIQLTATDNYYYIACGKLRRRPKNSSNWETIAVNGFVNTVAASSNNVYVGSITSGKTSKLFRYQEGGNITDITPSSISQILKLKNFAGTIIASVLFDNNTYGLYNISTSSPLISNITKPITDFCQNNFFTADKNIYNSSATIINPTDETLSYLSIYYDPAEGRYYAGTKEGIILKSTSSNPNSSEWQKSSSISYTKNGITAKVSFCYFTFLDNNKLIVATRGAGFYTLDKNNFPNNINRFSDTTKRELYEGAIEFIFNNESSPNPDIFFCTMGAGLWRNSWNNGWGSTWVRE